MAIEHDGCYECIYFTKYDDEFPCNACVGCIPYDDSRRKNAKDYFTIEKDIVNHPLHYTSGNIECIDAMESAFGTDELKIYCKIVAFKYLWRMERKNGLEDIKKAIWYLNKLVDLEEGGEPNDKD